MQKAYEGHGQDFSHFSVLMSHIKVTDLKKQSLKITKYVN